MSFRCYYTGKVAAPGTRAEKVIVEIRKKEYEFRPKAIPVRRKGRKKKQHRDDKGGVGWERVKEVMMTTEGARMFYESDQGQQLLAQMEAWSGGMMREDHNDTGADEAAGYDDEDDDDE